MFHKKREKYSPIKKRNHKVVIILHANSMVHFRYTMFFVEKTHIFTKRKYYSLVSIKTISAIRNHQIIHLHC